MWILDLLLTILAICGFSYWIYVANKFRRWINRNKNYSINTKYLTINAYKHVNKYDK